MIGIQYGSYNRPDISQWGRWEYNLEFSYMDGEAEVVENFDIDFLSYPHMLKKYKVQLGYPNLKNRFALKPGKKLDNGLYLLQDDNNIMKMVKHIRDVGCRQIHIYRDHNIDVPHFSLEGSFLEYRDGKKAVNEDSNVNDEGAGNYKTRTQCSHMESTPYIGSVGTNSSGWFKNIFINVNKANMSEVLGEDVVGGHEGQLHNEHYVLEVEVEVETEPVAEFSPEI